MEQFLYAFLIAAVLCLIAGPFFIPVLRRLKFGQTIREDGPAAHFKKAGTPTMGGVLFLVALPVATLWVAPVELEVMTALVVAVGYGIIGLLDDGIKVVLKRSLGLKAREKLLGQFLLAILLAWVSVHYLGRGTEIGLMGFTINLGILYYPFVVFVVVGASNAVNLTDGLDGLATGITFWVALSFGVIAVLLGKNGLAVLSFALAGACVGFLFFNAHPARVFMGDTGSLFLGGALGALAVLTGTELWLPVLGAVYVAETLSVILQVLSFKLTGKRIFRMSPLHHHFELGGWSERKVVAVFWTAALLACLISLTGFYLGFIHRM